jgi:hypothetical protein
MADAKGLQELISYFESGDLPSGAHFAALINSCTKCINGTFDDTDIDDFGIVTITYPVSVVNGVNTDTEITRPLMFTFHLAGTTTEEQGPYPCTPITSKTCKLNVGSKMPVGTYHYTLTYQL